MSDKSSRKRPWYVGALGALAVAVWCILVSRILGIEGYHTFRLFGSDAGLATIKSSPFIVWGGQLFRFPIHWVLVLVALVATAVATAITLDHFKMRRREL